jgi:hypothetical protein
MQATYPAYLILLAFISAVRRPTVLFYSFVYIVLNSVEWSPQTEMHICGSGRGLI